MIILEKIGSLTTGSETTYYAEMNKRSFGKALNQAPKPMSIQEFYVLLVLAIGPAYLYEIRSRAYDLSAGWADMANATVLPILLRLSEDDFVEDGGMQPAGKSGVQRRHYAITEWGVIRLKEEFARLEHAMDVAKYHGLLQQERPLEIEKIIVRAHWDR